MNSTNIQKFLLPVLVVTLCSITTYNRNIVWQDGVSVWKDVVAKSSHKARGYFNLGCYYRKQKQNDKAVENYSKAIALEPLHGKARINRGNVYDEQGEPFKAILDYNAAIGINGDNASAYYNRGVTYRNLGQYEGAKADFERSCEIGYEKACDALASLKEKQDRKR